MKLSELNLKNDWDFITYSPYIRTIENENLVKLITYLDNELLEFKKENPYLRDHFVIRLKPGTLCSSFLFLTKDFYTEVSFPKRTINNENHREFMGHAIIRTVLNMLDKRDLMRLFKADK